MRSSSRASPWAGRARAGLLVVGFSLVSVAGLELALREHFAGYRSHSTLLGGATAILLVVPLFELTELPYEVLLVLGRRSSPRPSRGCARSSRAGLRA